jgi:radical SAM protein with 4Fe4S-binding SPASM domain
MRELSYDGLSKRFTRIARKKRFPIRVMFELTYRCNFRCLHCYNTEEQKRTNPDNELKTKEVFNILKQLRDLGCFYLGFTGGEIFLRKDILDIIWYAKKMGFEIVLLTNGSMINKDIADKLSRLMLNKIDITVHSMHKNSFEKITQIPGSYEKVFRAIDLLKKRNVPLGIKSCCLKENKEEIVKISNFARKINAVFRLGDEILPRHDRSKIPLNHAVSFKESYALQRACFHETFDALEDNTIPIRRNIKKVFDCGAGNSNLTINPFGELKLCIEIDYPKYKILEGSLAKGWEIIKDFVDNLKPPDNWICKSCDLLPYCCWCPAKSYLENGTFFSCTSEVRKKAQFYRQLYTQNNKH